MQSRIKPAFNNNNVPICFFSDDRYVPYLGTAVYSAIKNCNSNTNLDIFIFENGFSDKNKEALLSLANGKSNISIRFLNLLSFVSALKVNPNEHVSINCYAKLFCIDEIFSAYERIIAFDSDLLILGDLLELMKLDMHEKPIAAVKDRFFYIMCTENYHTDERLGNILLKDYCKNLGLDINDYYNTGVILYDIKKSQERKLLEKMIQFNNKVPVTMYPAQDDFNVLLAGSWEELDLKWNYVNPYFLLHKKDKFENGYIEKSKDAIVMHYAGRSKPWETQNAQYDKLCGRLFDEYASETPWYEVYMEHKRFCMQKNRISDFILPKNSIRRSLFLKTKFFFKRLKQKYLFTNVSTNRNGGGQ